MAHESYESFDQVKARLDEIVDAVGSSEMPLDEALEENIEARDAEDEAEDGAGKAVCEAAAGTEVEIEAAASDAEASAAAAAQA